MKVEIVMPVSTQAHEISCTCGSKNVKAEAKSSSFGCTPDNVEEKLFSKPPVIECACLDCNRKWKHQ